MAKSINRVTILGTLGQDPELRSTSGGKSVCSLSIATNESYKDQSGEWKESTDWHRVQLWDRLADVASQYLSKGSKVYIEGKLRYGSYEKDGITRYTTDIVARELIMLDRPDSSGGGRSQGGSNRVNEDNGGYRNYQGGGKPENLADDNMTDDDDVPF